MFAASRGSLIVRGALGRSIQRSRFHQQRMDRLRAILERFAQRR
jgi:hypothetical protein